MTLMLFVVTCADGNDTLTGALGGSVRKNMHIHYFACAVLTQSSRTCITLQENC